MNLINSKKYLPFAIFGAVLIAAMVIFVRAPSEESAQRALDSLAESTVTEAIDTAAFKPNFSAVIHETLLNDLLGVTGYLKGTGPLLFKSRTSSFQWKAEQLHVQITDSGAVFTANVFVRGLGMKYKSLVTGMGKVEYDPDTEQIDLVLSDVPFDFRFKIFGKRIKVATMNVAGLIGPRVGILGSLPLFLDFNVKKIDGKKPLRLTVLRHEVRYEPERVIVELEVDFTENGDAGKSDQTDSSASGPEQLELNTEE